MVFRGDAKRQLMCVCVTLSVFPNNIYWRSSIFHVGYGLWWYFKTHLRRREINNRHIIHISQLNAALSLWNSLNHICYSVMNTNVMRLVPMEYESHIHLNLCVLLSSKYHLGGGWRGCGGVGGCTGGFSICRQDPEVVCFTNERLDPQTGLWSCTNRYFLY